jgi:membrane associated rhomboid family serine protease
MTALGSFFADWLKKLFAREAWVGVALIVIASIALFSGVCSYTEWAASAGGFAGLVTAGVLLKKKIEGP